MQDLESRGVIPQKSAAKLAKDSLLAQKGLFKFCATIFNALRAGVGVSLDDFVPERARPSDAPRTPDALTKQKVLIMCSDEEPAQRWTYTIDCVEAEKLRSHSFTELRSDTLE